MANEYLNKEELAYLVQLIKEELDKYVKSIAGKGLSTEDFTTELKQKLENLDTYAKKSELPTKESLGLDKVDNTPDSEKRVYFATRSDLANASTMAMCDYSGNIFETTYATKEEVSTVESIAKGANQAISFANYQEMSDALESISFSNIPYKVGQSILIEKIDVPDLWISEIKSERTTFAYANDEEIINSLKKNGYIEISFFRLSQLETQKVDLTEYVTKEELDAQIGDIETALDSIISEQEAIIAIQNSLIGGDSV